MFTPYYNSTDCYPCPECGAQVPYGYPHNCQVWRAWPWYGQPKVEIDDSGLRVALCKISDRLDKIESIQMEIAERLEMIEERLNE